MENPLAELEEWWDSQIDEGNLAVILRSFESRDDRYELSFQTTDYADPGAEWRLQIAECAEVRWRGYYGEPQWFADHVLLLPHLDRGGWISFSKPLKDPVRAYGAVAQAHDQIAGSWLRLDRCFRPRILNANFGILAEGPATLVSAYAEALLAIGEDVGVVASKEAVRVREPLLSVVIWGNSYFVARLIVLTRTA